MFAMMQAAYACRTTPDSLLDIQSTKREVLSESSSSDSSESKRVGG